MSGKNLAFVEVSGAVTLASGGTAAITSAAIDTVQNGIKYNRCTVVVGLGTMAASSGISVFKLQDSSASGGTYADITGATLGADPAGATDDDKFLYIDVDLVTNQVDRYIKAVVSTAESGNAAVNHVTAILSEPQYAPNEGDDLVTGGSVAI